MKVPLERESPVSRDTRLSPSERNGRTEYETKIELLDDVITAETAKREADPKF